MAGTLDTHIARVYVGPTGRSYDANSIRAAFRMNGLPEDTVEPYLVDGNQLGVAVTCSTSDSAVLDSTVRTLYPDSAPLEGRIFRHTYWEGRDTREDDTESDQELRDEAIAMIIRGAPEVDEDGLTVEPYGDTDILVVRTRANWEEIKEIVEEAVIDAAGI